MKSGLLYFAFITLSVGVEVPTPMVALDGDLGHGVPEVVERILGNDAVVKMSFLREKEGMGDIVADVFLDGGAIGAPVAKNLRFVPAPARAHSAVLDGSFTIPSPDTTKPISQIIVVDAIGDGNVRSRIAAFRLQWTSIATVQTALKTLPKLQVFGAVPGLREKLKSWHVSFEDLGADMPLRIDSQTFAVGDASQNETKLPDLGEQSSLLLLQEKRASAVEVWRKDAEGKRLTLVNLPRAADWRSNPLLYRILINHLIPAS